MRVADGLAADAGRAAVVALGDAVATGVPCVDRVAAMVGVGTAGMDVGVLAGAAVTGVGGGVAVAAGAGLAPQAAMNRAMAVAERQVSAERRMKVRRLSSRKARRSVCPEWRGGSRMGRSSCGAR